MSQPVRSITYNHENRDYTLYLNGEFVGFARTEFEGQVVLDRLVAEQAAQPTSPALHLAQLHLAYGKARSEGRLDEAQAIKAQAAALQAQAKVTYLEFEAAQTLVAEQQAS